MKEVIVKNKGILCVCGVYCAVSLVLFFTVFNGEAVTRGDAVNYIRLAQHLLQDQFFSYDGIDPNYFRTPGYPLFLALVYACKGTNNIVVIIQILLSSLKLFFVFRMMRMLKVPYKLALIGSVILLFNIISFEYSINLLTEALFGFFVMLFSYFFVKYLCGSKTTLNLFLLCFSLNYALLIRPVLFYFCLLMIVVFFAAWILKKTPFLHFLVLLVCFLVTAGGWSYRNYRYSGVFVYATSTSSTMAFNHTAAVTSRFEKMLEDKARGYHYLQFREEFPIVETNELNEAQVSRLRKQYSLAHMKSHFWQYAATALIGLINVLMGPSAAFLRGILGNGPLYFGLIGIYILYLCCIYLVYIAGLFSAYKTYKKISAPQLFIFVLSGYLAAVPSLIGYSRFRDPFFPLILLSAVANSGVIIQWLSNKLNMPVLKRIEHFLLHEKHPPAG